MPAGPLGPAQAPLQLNNNNTKVIAGSVSLLGLLSRPHGGDPFKARRRAARGELLQALHELFFRAPCSPVLFLILNIKFCLCDASRAAGGQGKCLTVLSWGEGCRCFAVTPWASRSGGRTCLDPKGGRVLCPALRGVADARTVIWRLGVRGRGGSMCPHSASKKWKNAPNPWNMWAVHKMGFLIILEM